jgi:hypothetical protein
MGITLSIGNKNYIFIQKYEHPRHQRNHSKNVPIIISFKFPAITTKILNNRKNFSVYFNMVYFLRYTIFNSNK